MQQSLEALQSFSKVIALSGSTPSAIEGMILREYFHTEEVKFPLMRDPFTIKISQK